MVSTALSTQARWDRYGAPMQSAVTAWLDANPTPETEPEELTACARRLGYSDTEQLLRDYERHTGQVNRIFERYI